MENASKALIIAGAILVSILIIGLGMTLYNNASGTLERVNIDQTAVKQFNAGFTDLEGQRNIKGTNVKALIRDVIAHNLKYKDDFSLWINVIDTNGVENTNRADESIDVNDYNESIRQIFTSIRSGTVYTLLCGYDDATGYVCSLSIFPTNSVLEHNT